MSNAIEELPHDLASALATMAQERARRVAAEAEAAAAKAEAANAKACLEICKGTKGEARQNNAA